MKVTMLATVLAFATLFSAVRAQPMHNHDPGEKVGGEAYSPGLGEIMALQQMRHSKLWFAGDARNWGLAGYELDELKEGFEGAAKLFPTVNGVSVGQAIGGILADEIPQIASAISAHDRTRFASAFDRLTASCNACHQSANVGMIVIQAPNSSPFANQDFRQP